MTVIDKSVDEFFNDYPCEWSDSASGLIDLVLTYKTGSIIGWIEFPDSADGTFKATFSPEGWSDAPDPLTHEAPSLETGQDWLQTAFLNFRYPEGWQFLG